MRSEYHAPHNCDAGDPTSNFTAPGKLADDLNALAATFTKRVDDYLASGGAQQPTISVT